MPFLSIISTELKNTLSPTLTLLLDPIMTYNIIPNDDIYLGVIMIALLFLCFWQVRNQAAIFESTVVGKQSLRNIMKKSPQWTATLIVVTGLAAVTEAVSMCTFLIANSNIVTIVSVFASVIPPYVIYLQKQITGLEGNYLYAVSKPYYWSTYLLCMHFFTLTEYSLLYLFCLCSNGRSNRRNERGA